LPTLYRFYDEIHMGNSNTYTGRWRKIIIYCTKHIRYVGLKV